ncbi:MAG TPA: glycosyltransferase family 2 protein [Methylomirabilota bacterium]|jgi:glycosyltransferase involved in cell wall biosynthesis|nr:glycosyltransferase family 2 protein [Methylomirabilota bacterium]
MHDGGRPGVGLVIPALDEEAAIGAVIRAVPPGLVDDLVVVDNGSTDRTAAVARTAGARVVAEPRRGYGAACWRGIQALHPEVAVVAFLDGDGSQDPRELPRVLDPIREDRADLVLGVRRYDAGAEHPRHAILGTRAVALVLRWRCGVAVRDIGPFRAIRRDALLALGLRDRSSGWPVEMVVKAARHGLRIAEVEVTQRPRLGGRSKVAGTLGGSLRAGWRFLRVALRQSR